MSLGLSKGPWSLRSFPLHFMILILSLICKYQHKTALPQVPVVACIDDGTTTWWCSYHPTLASSSPVCLRLPTTLTNSSVWCWLVLFGGGKPSFHDLSLKSLQKTIIIKQPRIPLWGCSPFEALHEIKSSLFTSSRDLYYKDNSR